MRSSIFTSGDEDLQFNETEIDTSTRHKDALFRRVQLKALVSIHSQEVTPVESRPKLRDGDKAMISLDKTETKVAITTRRPVWLVTRPKLLLAGRRSGCGLVFRALISAFVICD
ncbi:hypothetical protein Hanom_Chr12g01086081 [Helianthus anomalus]